jgi:hypothetical protein
MYRLITEDELAKIESGRSVALDFRFQKLYTPDLSKGGHFLKPRGVFTVYNSAVLTRFPEVLSMKIAAVAILPILFTLSMVSAGAQTRYPFPVATPTPTPRPQRSPSPTPEARTLPCPKVTVQAQSAKQVRDGQPVSFAANIAGGDPKIQPTLLWSTNGGFIKDGQGTRKVDVDTSGAGGLPDGELVADLWVGGYAPECVIQEKAKIKVIAPAAKFGEFGELPPKAVSENLAALASFLAQSQDNIYFFAYAGRKSERGYVANWLRKMKDELVIAGLNPRRVIAMDGGFREEPAFEFWVVPLGAEPPRPSPTVRRDEIVYPSTRAPARRPGT